MLNFLPYVNLWLELISDLEYPEEGFAYMHFNGVGSKNE